MTTERQVRAAKSGENRTRGRLYDLREALSTMGEWEILNAQRSSR
ncbi:MAG TPA: hypothetical protein VGM80_05350 [Gaiellaceae bacterium]